MTYILQEKIDRIINEIYTELFKQATPPSDFMKLKETGEAYQHDFFMKYYLPQDKQREIINHVLDKYKIKNRFDRDAFDRTINLGCSPNSSEESWRKQRYKL